MVWSGYLFQIKDLLAWYLICSDVQFYVLPLEVLLIINYFVFYLREPNKVSSFHQYDFDYAHTIIINCYHSMQCYEFTMVT